MKWKSQAGMSLVELMIGITLGLILLVTLVVVYLNGKQTFNLQNNVARIQEGARVAINVLSHEIHAAGFYGCTNESNAKNITDVAPPLKGYKTLAQYSAEPVNPSLSSSAFSNVTPPILVVRHGANNTLPVVTDMGNNPAAAITIASDMYKWSGTTPMMIISDCVGADMFTPTAISSTSIAHPALSKPYSTDARVMVAETSVFFLAQPTGRSFKSLYQRFTNGATTTDLRLADNVEEWYISYGYGNVDVDGLIVSYTDEDGINALPNAWSTVRAVRVALLLTSSANVLTEAAKYTFNFVEKTPSATDRLLRKEVASTIGVRNRITTTH